MNAEQDFFTTLKNEKGFQVTFCNYGATISSFKIPVNNKELDVVLGFDNVENYKKSFQLSHQPFLGAVVGPHAGRVNLGKYTDGEKEIQLEKNHNGHHLHGGSINLSNQFWELTSLMNDKIVFEISINNGKTRFRTEYLLILNTLHITLNAETEEDILINLTQHSYFNLAGHKNEVTDLEMKIEAFDFLELDSNLIPTGNLIPTKNSPFDFLEFKKCPSEIDTSFVVNEKQPSAILKNIENGLTLNVFTNQPTVHVYVGGNTGDILGKEGTVYHKTSGICFEAQNFPDSPNHVNFKNGILRKGEQYINKIAYEFTIEDEK
ncbi:aldose epimerase family protein [Chryseobacterium sp.]|uniref:aldose epimerase family protein n=1 Tax=Chryseobacterium sp. TaxID=1871047 RepID=UPI00289CA773|nr:aldose epimerase family protein [Chryseobacterium sp.]